MGDPQLVAMVVSTLSHGRSRRLDDNWRYPNFLGTPQLLDYDIPPHSVTLYTVWGRRCNAVLISW